MRLNHFRRLALTQTQIAEFNTAIATYNSRCSSYRYRQEVLERARREVDGVEPSCWQGSRRRGERARTLPRAMKRPGTSKRC